MSGSIYVDTNVFIKAFEAEDLEAHQAWSVLEAIGEGTLRGVTSELTLAEILPKPFATYADALATTYQSVLKTGAGLSVIPVTRDILIASSRLRAAAPQMRLPDSIHVATALGQGCSACLTGDLRIRSFTSLPVVRLSPGILDELQKLAA